MPREVELKLALGSDSPRLLCEHTLLRHLPSTCTTLTNTYYDTPDNALEAARIALRIRRTPSGILQTLKTAGQTGAGLSTRGEWEWPIDGELDVAGLVDLPPMQALDPAMLDDLEPRFSTDFERRIWFIEHDDARIELALDRGEIESGSHRVAINELELELKPGGRRSGDPRALWRLAAELAERVPLRLANASKAARGGALLKQRWPIVTHDESNKRDASLQAHFDWAIDALDAWADSGEQRFRQLAQESFAAIADASPSGEIREHADALAAALAMPDWLSTAFGRHSLALQQVLQRT